MYEQMICELTPRVCVETLRSSAERRDQGVNGVPTYVTTLQSVLSLMGFSWEFTKS